ncbi:hypothetical protein Pan44_34950 [Caulifigura coniformis]|uniref:Uncharacterized protein n=1 Tax=Caulifigura coniformis TaxID=2527983 RepID=A0A517SH67_9PLAN|nr:hypothetical protein Pan44_34950 [Caulifigura coniformis]
MLSPSDAGDMSQPAPAYRFRSDEVAIHSRTGRSQTTPQRSGPSTGKVHWPALPSRIANSRANRFRTPDRGQRAGGSLRNASPAMARETDSIALASTPTTIALPGAWICGPRTTSWPARRSLEPGGPVGRDCIRADDLRHSSGFEVPEVVRGHSARTAASRTARCPRTFQAPRLPTITMAAASSIQMGSASTSSTGANPRRSGRRFARRPRDLCCNGPSQSTQARQKGQAGLTAFALLS